jgi:hypothetical protein
MGDDRERHSTSKHKRSRDKDRDNEHRTKKKSKSEHKSHKRKSRTDAVHITDDDANDDDMWVEKNIDNDGERVSTCHISPRGADVLCSQASRDGHSNCRVLEDRYSCSCRND